MKILLVLSSIILSMGSFRAQDNKETMVKLNCAPLEYDPKILNKPDSKSVHADWVEAEVGESCSFLSTKKIENQFGVFLFGDLISPRGETLNKGCYVIMDQWDCSY